MFELLLSKYSEDITEITHNILSKYNIIMLQSKYDIIMPQVLKLKIEKKCRLILSEIFLVCIR